MKTYSQILVALALAVALLTPQAAHADVHQAQDLVAGNGTAGPYSLSWKHFLYGSEVVLLGDTTLHWGADYVVDPDAGTITFTHTLPMAEDAEVRYVYDPATAQAQGNGLSVPLSLALNPNLSLDGQFDRPSDTSAGPGALNFGLNGGWQNAHGGALTTHLLFVPAMTGQDADSAPDGLARLGLAVGGQTLLGRITQISFGLSRGGSGLGSAGGSDWTAGRENVTLGGTFTPSSKVQATLGYLQNDPTAPGASPAQSQTSAGLTLTPDSRLQLKTGFVQTVGGGSPTQTLNAAATLKPTGGSEVDAAYTNTTSPSAAAGAQNLDIKASVALDPKISLNAETNQSATGTNGVTQTMHASAVVKPTGQTQLGAAFSSTDAPGQLGDDQTLNLQAALTPNKALQLSTNVALCQNAAGDTQATTVAGSAQPNRFVQVNGGYTWRNVTSLQTAPPTVSDSSTAQVTLTPLAAVHLVGTYDQNPTDSSGNVQLQADHGLSLQTNMGALSLTGGYTWCRQYAACATATSLHVGLGLKFSSNTQLTGDYKHSLTDSVSPGGTDAYTLGLTRNLGDAFDLSLNGTMQQQTGTAAPQRTPSPPPPASA